MLSRTLSFLSENNDNGISILENFQQEDGSVKIPSALVPFTGFDIIKRKK